jgi:serine/threonine protein kinase
MGSPHYMSPEQARADKGVDLRADLWSVGVILYRATTGVLPFPGDVLGAVLSRILVDPVPPVATVAPDLPAAFDAFFAKAMAKSKEARFQSVRELVDAFVQIAGGVPMSSSGHISLGTSTPGIQTPFAAGATNPFPIVGAPTAPLVGTGPGTLTAANTSADRAPKPKRSALPWIAVAVLVLMAAGGGLFGWNRMQSANAGSTASGSSPAPDATVPAPVVMVPGTASSTPEPAPSGSASTPPESPSTTTGSSATPPKGSGRLPPRPVGTKKAGDGWGF